MVTYHGRDGGGYDYDGDGDQAAAFEAVAPETVARPGLVEPVSRWVRLAGAVTSVVLILGVVVWGYKLAVRDVSGVPIVRAIEGPARIAPEDPGGDLARHVGLSVNEVAGKGLAAPGPERVVLAPSPQALSADDVPMTGVQSLVKVERIEPEGLPEAEPATAPVSQVPQGTALAIPDEALPVDGPEALEGASAAQIRSAAAEAARIRPVARTVPVIPKDLSVRTTTTTSEAVSDTMPGVKTSPRPVGRPSTVRTAAAKAPVKADAPKADTTPVIKVAPVAKADEIDPDSLSDDARVAQIGAFDTAEIARAEWDRVASRAPAALAGKKRIVQQAEANGRTFYRLRVAGFDGVDATRRFCDALKTEGVNCIPTVVR
ncbi:MAG TPA: SPOR domain-containing protein [Paenirhodobacter sp.]